MYSGTLSLDELGTRESYANKLQQKEPLRHLCQQSEDVAMFDAFLTDFRITYLLFTAHIHKYGIIIF